MKILMCVNARLLDGRHRTTIGKVRKLLTDRGNQVELFLTSPLDAGPSLSPDLLSTFSPDTVYVCGGDGTVFDIVQTLAGTEVPLGVIPFGTGNILMQNLGFARRPLKTALALMSATPQRIQLSRLSLVCETSPPASWFFLSAAGVGPHAAVMTAALKHHKHRVGKPAYWAAGIRLLFSHKFEPFEVETTAINGTTSIARVNEAVALRVGALNVWRPGGNLRGNSLRLATVAATSSFGFAIAVFRALLQRKYPVVKSLSDNIVASAIPPTSARPNLNSVSYQDVVRIICRPLTDYKYRNPLYVQADGEILEASSVTIEMSEKTVNLLFPAAGKDA